MTLFEKAEKFLYDFKKDSYTHGPGILDRIGRTASRINTRAVLFRGTFHGSDGYTGIISESLKKEGVDLTGIFKGARPNAPRVDVLRMAGEIRESRPGLVISFGGGSTIDAVKAAVVLASLGGCLDDYMGVGLVADNISKTGTKLLPHIATQTLAGSAAHLTRYSNITDMKIVQKKLIIDDSIVPDYAFFDYSATYGAPSGTIADGAFDGISHLIEVLYSAENRPGFKLAYSIAGTGIELIVRYLPEVIEKPDWRKASDALCLGTDLGGYAIMVGGTNGAHLNSFSFVDILSHGRACAILNPYYSVFFAPAIEKSLGLICGILSKYGYTGKKYLTLSGRKLGIYTARAMIDYAKSVGFPTRLDEIEGFSRDQHIARALKAAKEPALLSKLQNMPIPLSAAMIDRYMGKVLESAAAGNLDIIENI